jgi:trimeric autotransporter adhesin
MADRYWVGGSGSWNSTTKWSATSGGASGASVPTASDNAIFDANSATAHYTVTVTDNATCADLTFTPEPANGVTQFAVGNNFVIAGTFSTSGTQGNRRVWFRSSTFGLMRDMQIATIGTVTDVDFREIRVTGTGGTLTGTRIGDLRGNLGITFSTPKNCYRIGTGNWSDDQWSDTSGGSVSTDNFPLAQDTAVFDESTTGGTHTMNNALIDVSGIDMSARTSALTLSLTSGQRIHGNWTFGSGITITGAQLISFYGRNTQVITSAGKTFSGSIFVVSYGGTVELADALNTGNNSLVITNGTFDTKGYNVTAGQVTSTNSNVREIKLGASTVTCGGDISFTTSTNLTLDAGTSSIICSGSAITFNGGSQTFYDVSFTSTNAATHTFTGANTFNNLSITAPASAGLRQVALAGNQTITGTLTAAGATAVRRTMLRSSVVGTTRTLTVGTLSADDCDFRDITIAGTAAGGSPTRAGDCGGNSGVTFPAPKTVYWNLAGSQNWSATAWATTSGGTPALDNFPLAQDTVVFDDTGAAGTVTVQTFNIGTVDMSARTSAMTLTPSSNAPTVYGSWSFGTGVTSSSASGTITFAGLGTSTITSNGVVFGNPVAIDCATGTVQLADALELQSTPTPRALTLTSGTFDAVSYNVTAGAFSSGVSTPRTLKTGSGTWTLSGTGNVWSVSSSLTLYKGTADILLSNTSTSTRAFQGGGLSYNKLTIGGATGTSTLTILSNNQFTELASTKTVAHTIALGTTTQTFGKWTVTGTAGNVVTLTGTGVNHQLVGACTDGIDYLAMGSIGFSASSPAEFYAGATSTGTAAAPVYRTAKPADSTRYWVGGTGNWNDTNRWSTSSGGAGGADLPRSHDDVVFDSSSNATAYTATVNAITGGNRSKALTIAGPASGNVTLAGSTALFIHDDITLPATGLTRTYTGAINLSGTGAGKTITTNGVALANSLNVTGVGAEWSLADALTTTNIITSNFGSFNTANYNLTVSSIFSNVNGSRAFTFGSSIVSISNTINFGTVENVRANLTFSAGTSQVNFTNFSPSSLDLNNQTFYNVSFTSTNLAAPSISGTNTFNNLTVAGRTGAGISQISLTADQTINGTLTLSAGTNATARTFVRSNNFGTTRTLTCAAVASLTDIDFRDITIVGAAAPVSGTRLGDCKGEHGHHV